MAKARSKNIPAQVKKSQNGFLAVKHSLEAALYGPDAPQRVSEFQILLYVRHRCLRDRIRRKEIPASEIQAATGLSIRAVEYGLSSLSQSKHLRITKTKSGKNLLELHPERFGENYIWDEKVIHSEPQSYPHEHQSYPHEPTSYPHEENGPQIAAGVRPQIAAGVNANGCGRQIPESAPRADDFVSKNPFKNLLKEPFPKWGQNRGPAATTPLEIEEEKKRQRQAFEESERRRSSSS